MAKVPPYDQHVACREEIEYWRKEHAEKDRVKQVVVQIDDPSDHTTSYKVLQIVRVDAFKDGLRVLVR